MGIFRKAAKTQPEEGVAQPPLTKAELKAQKSAAKLERKATQKLAAAEKKAEAKQVQEEKKVAAAEKKAEVKQAKLERKATQKLEKLERKATKKGLKVADAGAPHAAAAAEDLKPATVLFLGCDDAGKTSMIKALAGVKLGKADPYPTSGFDGTGKAQRDGVDLSLFDVGGGPRIRGVWRSYYADAHAVVFVVDAAAPDRFAEASQLLKEAAEHEAIKGKPMLVVAHKQDRPQAVSGAELAEALRVHEIEGSGTTCQVGAGSLGEGPTIGKASELDQAFSWLLGAVHEEYDVLSKRLAQDLAKQKEAEETRKAERKARLAAKKAEREKAEAEEAAAKAAAEGAAGALEAPAVPAAA